jgi:RHS repeat-associated protein
MLMPGRKYKAGSGLYRYGFNGKENDNEAKGEGNQIDYDKRIYDSRLARFYSVDPLQTKFPFYSPYQFAGNTPIQAIDLDGAEEYHYTMSMNNQGKAILNLVDVKYSNHHSWFWGAIEFDTKIEVKRYKIDYDNKSYHIGYSQYGTGYSNSGKAEEFENNYIKKQGDAIAFEYNYVDDNHSVAASDAAIVTNSQNIGAETAIPFEGATTPNKVTNKTSTEIHGGNTESAHANTNTVLRTQGGQGTNSSSGRISVGSNGEVSILGDNMLFITIDDKAHSIYFYNKRGGSENGAAIVSFKIPQSLADEIKSLAVPQAQAKAFPDRPQTVDITKSKSAYGLPKNYIEKLRKQLVQGTGKIEAPKSKKK